MRRVSIFSTVLLAVFCAGWLWPATRIHTPEPCNRQPTAITSPVPNIPSDQLRQLALHDAGELYCPVGCGGFAPISNYFPPYMDLETGLGLNRVMFPSGTKNQYLFSGDLWVGGIIGGDTLVSQAFDNWFAGFNREFWPPDPYVGGIHRTGRFADDEFVAVFTDTMTDTIFVGSQFPYDDSPHKPMHIRVRQNSYSWKDTLYDNFVIFSYVIENIGPDVIHDGWLGIEVDPDVTNTQDEFSYGYWDDFSGLLDTLLDDNEPSSRVLIPYAYDDDGDPGYDCWSDSSVTGVISLALLATSIPEPRINFNWWVSSMLDPMNFGPRRVGTVEDPFRSFDPPMLGSPWKQEDRYYVMSHPERDYDQIEMKVHDSADGWIPAEAPFDKYTHDTRILLSLGSFELAPGDSVSFSFALVASEGFHVDPNDYATYFDPDNPAAYRDRLDFTDLMTNHRRVDSVYHSGLTLPNPGPPQGLRITDYDDSYVTLAWHPSGIPNPRGYFINICDTVYDHVWYHAHAEPVHDTSCTVPIFFSDHRYFLAVSVVDAWGRESDVSLATDFYPARPHPPKNLTLDLENGFPRLTWEPPGDTELVVYMIYRSIWNRQPTPYDSVSALSYRDNRAESGVRYTYAITARNMLDFESAPSEPASILPMAFDNILLLYNMNDDHSASVGPYRREYLDELIGSIGPTLTPDVMNTEDSELTLKEMSRFKAIIFDAEKRGGRFPMMLLDSIAIYLDNGGTALFIIPNASVEDVGMFYLKIHRYAPGDFFHDNLYLDSSVTNRICLAANHIVGDLMGCASWSPEYPTLEADSQKMVSAPIAIEGYLPMSGIVFPDDDIEILYRYESCNPDSTFHGQINGLRHIGDTGSFVFFNFPLSLMKTPGNVLAFRRALSDLGVDVECGNVNMDAGTNIGDAVFLVNYLYRGGPAPPDDGRADVNCDEAVDLEDVLVIINMIFKEGPWPACCR